MYWTDACRTHQHHCDGMEGVTHIAIDAAQEEAALQGCIVAYLTVHGSCPSQLTAIMSTAAAPTTRIFSIGTLGSSNSNDGDDDGIPLFKKNEHAYNTVDESICLHGVDTASEERKPKTRQEGGRSGDMCCHRWDTYRCPRFLRDLVKDCTFVKNPHFLVAGSCMCTCTTCRNLSLRAHASFRKAMKPPGGGISM